MKNLSSNSIYSDFKQIIFFSLFNTYTWPLLVLCWGRKGQVQGNLSSPRVPLLESGSEKHTYKMAACVRPGRLAAQASVQCFFKHNYQGSLRWPLIAVVFGKLHSDADWPKSYQPIQPYVWVCVSVCAHIRLWTHITHVFICTYINSP